MRYNLSYNISSLDVPYWFILLLLIINFSPAVHGQFHAQRESALMSNSKWYMGNYGLHLNHPIPEKVRTDKAFDIYYNNGIGLGRVSRYGTKFSNSNFACHPQTGALRLLCLPGTIFDANLDPMPNGSFTNNNLALNAEKITAIAPHLNNTDKYYFFKLFRNEEVANPEDGEIILSYSTVDMNLNNGLGDVEQSTKNSLIKKFGQVSSITEIIGIIPGNNCDYWLLVAENANVLSIYSFHITNDGIDTIPVKSTIPKIDINQSIWDYHVSPNRNIIAYISLDFPFSKVNFLSLNIETGSVIQSSKPPISLSASTINANGIFTPDNNYFLAYANSYKDGIATFYKYDLNTYFNDNYRYSLFNYDFKYIKFNESEHANYISPIINFKIYGDAIYFNIPKHTTWPSSIEPDLKNVGINPFAFRLVGIEPLIINNWAEIKVKTDIELSNLCTFFTNNDIVSPYTILDTVPNMYFDTIICLDPLSLFPNITLMAKEGFTDYVWDDGSIGTERNISEAGKYWVTYKGSCNTRVDTFSYRMWVADNVIGNDTVICEQRFPVTLNVTNAGTLLWDDNSTDKKRWIQEPGKYWVQFQNYGCIQRDSIIITSKFCPCDISLPNAFSPNGDGLNDYFKPIIALGCVPQGYSFRIFNRWGQLVYSSFDEFDKGWDGTKNGLQSEIGNYIYEVRFKSKFLDNDYYAKGELMLVR